jgi:DNA-directed RNA polymerase specialized sigma24 family protein
MTDDGRVPFRQGGRAMQGADRDLDSISTAWPLLRRTQDADAATAKLAADELFLRYRPAAVRYLVALTGDPNVAEDLCHDLYLKFRARAFDAAMPEKGRFRNFLKTVLRNQYRSHLRRASVRAACAIDDAEVSDAEVLDRTWEAAAREELIACGWKALEVAEAAGGAAHAEILRAADENPDRTSDELAEYFTAKWGRPTTAGWLRKRLYEARRRFADAILDAVAAWVHPEGADAVRDELTALGLIPFPAIEAAWVRWAAGREPSP